MTPISATLVDTCEWEDAETDESEPIATAPEHTSTAPNAIRPRNARMRLRSARIAAAAIRDLDRTPDILPEAIRTRAFRQLEKSHTLRELIDEVAQTGRTSLHTASDSLPTSTPNIEEAV